ncbi:MAG: hypothetical protein M1823_001333 [Watsoniomyces obsoletus]|nr:MAG: hypothetical protein M1823_001333 [Watsoniomyces obsoletus]
MLGIPPSSYTVQETTSADSIRNFARDVLGPNARSGIRQTVLLLSGDGGVHDLLNGLLAGVSSDITSPRVATASTGPMDLDRKVSHQESGYVTPTIALLALGTANALAHSLGTLQSHPSSLGLRTLFHGRVKPLPIFHAVFSPGARLLTDEGRSREQIPGNQNVIHGAVVFSYGLHASLVADSDSAAYRKFGAKRFQMAAKELLFPSDGGMPHAYRGKVSILRPNPTNIEADEGEGKRGEEKNEIWEDIPREEHAYVLATLVSNLEEKFMISPLSAISRPSHPVPSIAKEEAPAQDIQKKKKGRVNEGKMYLIHFPPLPGEEINRIMTLAYQGGQHVHEKAVGYEEVEGVRIELPSELDEHSGPGHGTQDRIQDEKQDDDEDNEARWRKICVDGTIIELERGGWVEMRKGPFISSSSHRVIQPIPSTSAYPKEIEEKNEATSVLNIVVPLKLR